MRAQEELHITSLVVHAVPARLHGVADAISRIPIAEVHALAPAGKAVVTLESLSGDEITAAVAAIQQLPGVLAATLVYQCVDSLDSMNEEISDAQA